MLVFKSKFSVAISVILALVASLFISIMQPQAAQASHYRGTFATVEYHAPSGGDAAEVHIVSTMLIAKDDNGGFDDVRVYRTVDGALTPVTDCSGTADPSESVDNSNPLFEITTNTWTVTGCFSTPGEYTFEAEDCCRIGDILNTSNDSIQFEAKLSIDGLNDSSSPTYNAGYMYNIAYEVGLSYSTNLGGLGQGNTSVTYDLVTDDSEALGGYGASRVPCSNLNLSTGAYQINSSFCTGDETIIEAFGGVQKYYALKVRATDANGQYSTRDVLLNFATTTNQAPAFTSVPAAGDFTVTPGTIGTAQFCAQDPDDDVVGFTFSPTRVWITTSVITAVDPATVPNTYCVTFTLSPPVGTSEAFNFEVSAFDDDNEFVRSASNIFSFQAGAVLPDSQTLPAADYVFTGVEVISISPTDILVGNSREVKITGRNLGGATKLVVRGIPLTVKLSTDSELIFEMPAQLLDGFADISFVTSSGSLSWGNALRFLPNPASLGLLTNENSKAEKYISTFAGDKASLTTKMKITIAGWVKTLPRNAVITCQGSTSGSKVTAFDKRLAFNRAENVCVDAVKRRADLTYVIKLNPSSATKASARHVWMTQG